MSVECLLGSSIILYFIAHEPFWSSRSVVEHMSTSILILRWRAANVVRGHDRRRRGTRRTGKRRLQEVTRRRKGTLDGAGGTLAAPVPVVRRTTPVEICTHADEMSESPQSRP